MVPVQPRHPIALAQQALSVQAVCEGRLALGLGVSHHWVIDEMLGLPYERPVATMRAYLDVLDQALAGPGPVDVENELFRVHNPLDITDITPTPVLIAALGPLMLQLARRTHRRHDPVDGRRAGHRLAHRPELNAAAEAAGRPAPRIVAGIPVCLCGDDEIDAAVARTNRILAEAEVSPNYQKLLDHGDARSVGDILAAGSEATIEKRLRAFADAGVTDSRCGWCPSARAATSSSPRPSAPVTCSPRSPRRSDDCPGSMERSSAGSRPSQSGSRRQRPGGEQVVAEVPRQRAGGAEQLVEHEDPADVAVQGVLGGEADAGQHLLAVAGRGAGAAAGERLGHGRRSGRDPSARRRRAAASAVSMATSVSASRWRTAWNEAIGRPNWIRSRACCAGQLEHRPRRADELVAEGELGERDRVGPPR